MRRLDRSEDKNTPRSIFHAAGQLWYISVLGASEEEQG